MNLILMKLKKKVKIVINTLEVKNNNQSFIPIETKEENMSKEEFQIPEEQPQESKIGK